MSHTRVLRFSVPLDDKAHPIAIGKPVLTAVRDNLVAGVEVWIETEVADNFPEGGYDTRQAQVFGTGHHIPDGTEHIGSCLDGGLVWHVYGVEDQR